MSKEYSSVNLIQFFVCLKLVFVASKFKISLTYRDRLNNHLFSLSILFCNSFLAVGYLLMPFIVMLTIDMRSSRKSKKDKELERVTETYLKDTVTVEKNSK